MGYDINSYNGYTNYETWAMNLEMCNDIAEVWREEGRRFYTIGELKDAMQQYVMEFFEECRGSENIVGNDTNIWYGWAMRAVNKVDWWDIARTHAEDLCDEQWEEN